MNQPIHARKTGTGHILNLMTLFSLVLMTSPAAAAEAEAGAGASLDSPFEFRVEVTPQSILPFEGVATTCTVRNISGEEIEDGPVFHLGAGDYVQVLVSRDGASAAPVAAFTVHADMMHGALRRTYEPHERIWKVNCFRETLFDDWGFLFPEPGDYRLQLKIFSIDRTSTLTSNSVEVKVEEPKGLVADAYRELCAQINMPAPTPLYGTSYPQRPAERKCLLNKPIYTPAEVALAEDFINRFSETRYAAEVRCHLGNFWFRNGDYDECARLHIEAISGDCGPEVWRPIPMLPRMLRTQGANDAADRLSAAIEKQRARFAGVPGVLW